MFYITGSFIILYYCHKRQNIFYGSEMEGISRSAGLQLQKVLVPPPPTTPTSTSKQLLSTRPLSLEEAARRGKKKAPHL